VLSGRGLCDELTTRPEESYLLCCVVVCDLETSRIGAPYIYVCDISSLMVNDLTLILLTWRKS
jgi:ligand-binding sensor protein